jgi:hypothetical protein
MIYVLLGLGWIVVGSGVAIVFGGLSTDREQNDQ